jgi:CDP-glucose 4,6-dehydratase
MAKVSALEIMDLTALETVYRGRRVLVTGHTGFKGSWLALWLSRLGAKVAGLALPPETEPNHFKLLDLDILNLLGDIRQSGIVNDAFARICPDIVFHLAAQPLVRHSYQDPLETFGTNIMGTAHVLEACRTCPSCRAVVVITSDKCYCNKEWLWGYREIDALGGHDPYSASKACAELVAASYRSSFFHASGPLLATARGGNVIGGGDWSTNRLIPDLVRAITVGSSLEIRYPNARRPWQHVLDCLHGYLLLGAGLLAGRSELADAWNFGPDPSSSTTVAEILDKAKNLWPDLRWHAAGESQPHEAGMLSIDSTKAHDILGWWSVWNLDVALKRTIDWYRKHRETGRGPSDVQLEAYLRDAEIPR